MTGYSRSENVVRPIQKCSQRSGMGFGQSTKIKTVAGVTARESLSAKLGFKTETLIKGFYLRFIIRSNEFANHPVVFLL